jgi:putative transposase
MTSPRTHRYPSDLTDAQWNRLESLLPPARALGRHRTVPLRDVANAINYRWETGCVWRMLPHDFPPWATVYAYFRSWQRAGVIRQLREILLEARPRHLSRLNSAATRKGLLTPSERPDREPSPPDRQRAPHSGEHGFSSPHDRGESRPTGAPHAAPLPDNPPA